MLRHTQEPTTRLTNLSLLQMLLRELDIHVIDNLGSSPQHSPIFDQLARNLWSRATVYASDKPESEPNWGTIHNSRSCGLNAYVRGCIVKVDCYQANYAVQSAEFDLSDPECLERLQSYVSAHLQPQRYSDTYVLNATVS